MHIISGFLKFSKAVAYGAIAFFVYSNFIGPEGVAEIFGDSKNINQDGTKKAAILLSEGLIKWTIVAAVLELVDNFIEIIPKIKNKVSS